MRLLLITGRLYPKCDANSEIAYRIAKVLKDNYHCDVTILGQKTENNTKNPFGIVEETVPILSKCFDIDNKFKKKTMRRLMLIFHPKCFAYTFMCKVHFRYAKSFLLERTIKSLSHKKCYDCIIVFSAPVDALISLSWGRISIPYISYKLDPWSTNYNTIDQEFDRKNEIRSDEQSKRIILTDLLKKEYARIYDKSLMDKTISLGFPNIVRRDSIIPTNKTKITCVYTGGLYKDIRNPRYMLELFRYFTDLGIELDIYGYQSGNCIDIEQLPENIHYYGAITYSEAERKMMSADILVNIGNTVSNQMPSKILTYISTGKPILNIVKTEKCPTLQFTASYPFALDIIETNEVQADAVESVKNFIYKSCGKCVEFKQIQKLYYENTPEYVGQKLYEVICDVAQADKHNNMLYKKN